MREWGGGWGGGLGKGKGDGDERERGRRMWKGDMKNGDGEKLMGKMDKKKWGKEGGVDKKDK